MLAAARMSATGGKLAASGVARRPLKATVGEIFSVKRGIATAANAFFIMTGEQAAVRGIPRQCLRPILPAARRLKADEVPAGEGAEQDTDRERSTQEAVDVILDGMRWLELDADEGPYFQSQRYPRYRQVIAELLERGAAYRCYRTRAELDEMRAQRAAPSRRD